MAFTPLSALAGGALIGLSAVVLMAGLGRVAGISGIFTTALVGGRGDLGWRLAFLIGLIGAPVLIGLVRGAAIETTVSDNLMLMGAAGLLVGIGTVTGSGCTSGHGVCGLARLSRRSMVSVATFMAVAVATVFVTRHVIGG